MNRGLALLRLPAPSEQTLKSIMTWATSFLLVMVLGSQLHFPLWDWHVNYQPRILELLHGQNPYVHVSYAPPWFQLLLAPLVFLPERLADALLFTLTVFTIVHLARRTGLRPVYIACLLVSYPVYKQLQHGQLDWLVVSGVLLPPVWGLFLVLAKPQVGLGIALYWAYDLFKKGGFSAVAPAFAPVIIGYSVSFLLFGPYPFRAAREFSQPYNASLWPYAIPIGLFLLVWSIRHKGIYLAMASSPFISPYVALYSWMGALLGIARNRWWFAVLCLASWLVAKFA